MSADLPINGGDCTRASELHDFWQALLPASFQNAFRTEFYRLHWAGELPALDPASLHRLPTVTKQQIRDAGVRAQVRDGLICDEIFTSGTTGVPLVTVRGNREQQYIRDFFGELYKGIQPPFMRGLHINNPYHGYQVSIPSPIHLHRIGIYDNGSFEHGWRVLTKQHHDEGVAARCSILIGLERCLRAFTLDTHKRYPMGLGTSLAVVVSYSQYLTRHWRELFHATWRCPVVDRFSLSEIFGGAGQCLKCGWWHFDPFVIPEVVSHNRFLPIREGVGILVLTALYPFQEAQPMMRYLTGDLVEVTHTRGCEPDVLSMRPLGRAAFGVPFPGTDQWLLTPAAILEVIEGLPGVARLPRFLDSSEVVDPFAIGHPKYHTSYFEKSGCVYIRINIETVGESNTVDQIDFAKKVKEALMRESEGLRHALSLGRASLEIISTKTLETDLISHSM